MQSLQNQLSANPAEFKSGWSEVRQLAVDFEKIGLQCYASHSAVIAAEPKHDHNCTVVDLEAQKRQYVEALLAEGRHFVHDHSSLHRSFKNTLRDDTNRAPVELLQSLFRSCTWTYCTHSLWFKNAGREKGRGVLSKYLVDHLIAWQSSVVYCRCKQLAIEYFSRSWAERSALLVACESVTCLEHPTVNLDFPVFFIVVVSVKVLIIVFEHVVVPITLSFIKIFTVVGGAVFLYLSRLASLKLRLPWWLTWSLAFP